MGLVLKLMAHYMLNENKEFFSTTAGAVKYYSFVLRECAHSMGDFQGCRIIITIVRVSGGGGGGGEGGA